MIKANAESKLDALWSKALLETGIESSELIASSSLSPGRRAYATDKYIYKIVLRDQDTPFYRREQDLEGEFSILNHCAGIPGIPNAAKCMQHDYFEVLVLERMDGIPLSRLDVGFLNTLAITAKLSLIAFKLSCKGISHNDFRQDNILLSSTGKVSLIDFDQASRSGFLRAIIRSFTGRNLGGPLVHNSVFQVVKDYLKKVSPPGAIGFLKRLKGYNAKSVLPVLPDNASPQLKTLLEAWKLAQASDASSPGIRIAYYSFDYEGYHFPGERPWRERWSVLSSVSNYSGKRILELGCNMSLLSCHLLREKGASQALAVDIDKKVLSAAEMTASALGVKPLYRQQNLDAPDDWESSLTAFRPDIVFALNVLNWVQDKQRLMNFLGRFNEVIFEGHDSFDTESARFRAVGFKQIKLVATSERNRDILHCLK